MSLLRNHRVFYTQRSRPSGRLLGRSLHQAGYDGPAVNFGVAAPFTAIGRGARLIGSGHIVNRPDRVVVASNKRLALRVMAEARVPVPHQMDYEQACQWIEEVGTTLVGRPDQHRAGSDFHYILHRGQLDEAHAQRCTHYMPYITHCREFRCHVVAELSIKLTEKVHRSGLRMDSAYPVIRSHENGWVHEPAPEGYHRVTMREFAKMALRSLGLDFGAVDILVQEINDGVNYYVLEVNTAPNLADPTSDTLDRYTQAILTQF